MFGRQPGRQSVRVQHSSCTPLTPHSARTPSVQLDPDRALGAYIHGDLYTRAAAAFRKFMQRVATPAIGRELQRYNR